MPAATDGNALSLVDRILPLLPVIRNYDGAKAKKDLIAGMTVALFTIPQAMAYAIIAGFPPSAGIFTAIVASILGAAFGSSEFLINGPTNAISAMIASNVALLASGGDPQKLVILLTLMIGVMQLVTSAFKAGNLTRFVSEPVLIGFTGGAGIYIGVNQLASALGIEKKQVAKDLWGWKPPSDPLFDFLRTVVSFAHTNMVALGVSVGTVVLVRLLQWYEPKMKHRIPATFITVVVVSVVAFLLGLGDPAQGARKIKLVVDIEPVTRALPKLVVPDVSWANIRLLLEPAFAIGLLGAVEAIAIGKALASRAGHRFNANRQLVGEAAGNLGAALVGGFSASGSFSRTAVNFDAGAVTRLSCVWSGLLILGIVFLFAPAAGFIPIAVLAGMLIHIGIRLINVAKMKLISQTSRSDKWIMFATFTGVLIFTQLEHALFLGVVLSIFAALRRAEKFKLKLLREDAEGHLIEEPLVPENCGDVVALDLQGEMFFAAAEVLEERLRNVYECGARFVVLRLQQAYNMDHTCAEILVNVSREARRHNGRLILCGVRPGVYKILERAEVIEALGKDAVFLSEPTKLGSTYKALEYARQLSANSLG